MIDSGLGLKTGGWGSNQHYAVTARLKSFPAAEFYENLTDGTLETQKPDGEEIIASMKRTRITQD